MDCAAYDQLTVVNVVDEHKRSKCFSFGICVIQPFPGKQELEL